MNYKVEKIASENAVVGEGPIWHPEDQVLYWTDIQGGKFWKYDPETGENLQIHNGDFICGISVNEMGGLTLGTWEGVKLWKSDNDWRWIHHGDVEGKPTKLNDVIAGPDGSFYAGSAHVESCTLFKFSNNGEAEIVDDGLELCNGMGFSPDLSTFYSTDSLAFEIYQWDYNLKTAALSRRRLFTKVDPELGLPDGMTVDAEGFLWSAIWNAGTVIRFDPDGKEERRINVPALQTSCPMFGGKELNELYISTASIGSIDDPTGHEPTGFDWSAHRGGELYRVILDIQGKPEYKTTFDWFV